MLLILLKCLERVFDLEFAVLSWILVHHWVILEDDFWLLLRITLLEPTLKLLLQLPFSILPFILLVHGGLHVLVAHAHLLPLLRLDLEELVVVVRLPFPVLLLDVVWVQDLAQALLAVRLVFVVQLLLRLLIQPLLKYLRQQ